MAVNITLNDVTSGFSRSLINTNFQLIETALQDALSRSGGSPNIMEADIDLNSNDLLNAGIVNTAVLKVAGVTVTDATYVPDWKGPWVTSTSYVINDLIQEAGSSYICLVAHTSGTFSTDLTALNWELFAQQGSAGAGTGDMLAANNLSDVANAATSLANIGGIGSLVADTTPQLGGSLDTNSKQVNESKGADVASATALTLGADGNYFDITGTTAITSIVTRGVGTEVTLHFDAVLTLTHHATNLILPSGANITTAAGDEAVLREYATGDWRCVSYSPASGLPVIANGWEHIDTHTWANDFASYTKTGLNLYKSVRVMFFLNLSSAGSTLQVIARVSSGSDRVILETPAVASDNDGAVGWVEARSFNSAVRKPLFGGWGIDTGIEARTVFGNISPATSLNSTLSDERIAYMDQEEVWDEIEVTPDVGNIEGSGIGSRGYIIIEGMR